MVCPKFLTKYQFFTDVLAQLIEGTLNTTLRRHRIKWICLIGADFQKLFKLFLVIIITLSFQFCRKNFPFIIMLIHLLLHITLIIDSTHKLLSKFPQLDILGNLFVHNIGQFLDKLIFFILLAIIIGVINSLDILVGKLMMWIFKYLIRLC